MTIEGGNAVKGTGLAGAIAGARKKAYPEGYVSSKDPLVNLESKAVVDYLLLNGVGIPIVSTAGIEDSTDKRFVTDDQLALIENTSGINSGNETVSSIGSLINTSSEIITPVDTDMIGTMNSSSLNILSKLSWSNIKASLKTYFDTLYTGSWFKNQSLTTQTGFSSHTYLNGSTITVPIGGWLQGTTYRLVFDMTKTAAGTGLFTIIVRMGTTGSKADTAIYSIVFGDGTAEVDTGVFELLMTFRSVGASSSAYIVCKCNHLLLSTGLISGASGCGIITGYASGFSSTTCSKIGVGVSGGTLFSGTCRLVQAELKL